MDLWIPITVGSAFLQNLRSAVQKHLKGVMSTTSATFVRFGFGFPFAIGFVALLHFGLGYRVPPMGATFCIWVLVGGVTQIAATFLLVHLFSFRNFAVGTAYSRTEPAQAAIFGLIFLAEKVTPGTLVAICISIVGVMMISVAHMRITARNLATSLGSRTALTGLASGTCFGISAVAYRAASLALEGPNFMMQAALTLACFTVFQTLVMSAWLAWRERGEFARIAKAWRASLFVGLVGGTASFGWFMAMTLQQAAVVKSLAQIEMLFTIASSVFVFRERVKPLEIAGCLLIVSGILVLLAVR